MCGVWCVCVCVRMCEGVNTTSILFYSLIPTLSLAQLALLTMKARNKATCIPPVPYTRIVSCKFESLKLLVLPLFIFPSSRSLPYLSFFISSLQFFPPLHSTLCGLFPVTVPYNRLCSCVQISSSVLVADVVMESQSNPSGVDSQALFCHGIRSS